jgi:hypothetical protein
MTPEDLNYERYRVSHLRDTLAKRRGSRCVCTLVWSLDLDEDRKRTREWTYGILITKQSSNMVSCSHTDTNNHLGFVRAQDKLQMLAST